MKKMLSMSIMLLVSFGTIAARNLIHSLTVQELAEELNINVQEADKLISRMN